MKFLSFLFMSTISLFCSSCATNSSFAGCDISHLPGTLSYITSGPKITKKAPRTLDRESDRAFIRESNR